MEREVQMGTITIYVLLGVRMLDDGSSYSSPDFDACLQRAASPLLECEHGHVQVTLHVVVLLPLAIPFLFSFFPRYSLKHIWLNWSRKSNV